MVPTPAALTPEHRDRSDLVTGLARIADLRLSRIRADLRIVNPAPPLTTNYEVIPTMLRLSDTAVVYHIVYNVTATTKLNRLAFEAAITISVIIELDSPDLSEEDLQAFGVIGVLDIAHPYVRETVHTLAARMGLPPLVLEIKVPVSMMKF